MNIEKAQKNSLENIKLNLKLKLAALCVYIGDSGPSISLEYGPRVSVIPGQQL
jgi:hypothetical protein